MPSNTVISWSVSNPNDPTNVPSINTHLAQFSSTDASIPKSLIDPDLIYTITATTSFGADEYIASGPFNVHTSYRDGSCGCSGPGIQIFDLICGTAPQNPTIHYEEAPVTG